MIANPVPVSVRHPKMTYQLTITYKLEATLKFETEKNARNWMDNWEDYDPKSLDWWEHATEMELVDKNEKVIRVVYCDMSPERGAPVPLSVRHPTRLDCDEDGRCWWFYQPVADQHDGCWQFESDALYRYPRYWPTHWLPANTPFPIP